MVDDEAQSTHEALAPQVAQRLYHPNKPHHFMRIKSVKRRIEVRREGVLLASSSDALRLLEVGRDIYDPVLYLPAVDVVCRLVRTRRTSHCPLKGDAAYFDLIDEADSVIEREIAWSYPDPISLAAEIKQRIAFYVSRVAIQESPL